MPPLGAGFAGDRVEPQHVEIAELAAILPRAPTLIAARWNAMI
jgi:hypothetical protein